MLTFLVFGVILGTLVGVYVTKRTLESQFNEKALVLRREIKTQQDEILLLKTNAEKNVRLVFGHNESCTVSITK